MKKKRLRDRVELLEHILCCVEWAAEVNVPTSDGNGRPTTIVEDACPYCYETREGGHSPDCALAVALGKA